MPNQAKKTFNKKKQTQPFDEPENEPTSSTEASTSKSKPKKKPSQKRAARDENRMTDFRAKQSEKTVQQDREALYEKLFFGFKNVTEAMKNIELQQVQRTIVIPISTRSVGFIIRNLMSRFVRLGVLTLDEAKSLAAALYRITLLQVDYKLEEAMLLQHSRNLELPSYEDTYLTGDIRRALDMMGAGFSPLVNYVSAIGFTKTASKSYLPRHPKINSYSPFYLRYSNLRSTVEALSGQVMSVEAKREFMLHSPIPTAEWIVRNARRNLEGVEIPGTVTLANPEFIMPTLYGLDNVREDIAIIATAIEKVGRKYAKYVCTGGIDWKGQGSISQIISNDPARIRCPTWPILGQVSLVDGEHDRFWSAELMSDPEAYMGVVYMLGEVKVDDLSVTECAAYRMHKAACTEINLDYASVMQNLLN